ncbi:hypothetical protein TPA0905_74570 [Streptomyces olivaceus]|nr:hypothetical protein TPA0905_74570 [Streptomyces olivaceus]
MSILVFLSVLAYESRDGQYGRGSGRADEYAYPSAAAGQRAEWTCSWNRRYQPGE